MLRTFLILISLLFCSTSFADSVLLKKPDLDKNIYKKDAEKIMNMKVSSDEYKDIFRSATSIVDVTKKRMNSSGIADENMQGERDEVMKFLGLDKTDYNIYIFISFSMNDEMIKAYVKEAIWTGAIVVVRGIAKDETLKSFVFKKLKPLVGKKGGTATIQIDPRLFDVFEINSVPSIVLTKKPSMGLCHTITNKVIINKQEYPFPSCEPLLEDDYLKISGAVSLSWALEQFIEEGSEEAAIALEVLKKNVKPSNSKEQTAFKGDWNKIYTPEQEQLIKESLKEKGTLYQTPQGLTVGLPGLEDKENDIIQINE